MKKLILEQIEFIEYMHGYIKNDKLEDFEDYLKTYIERNILEQLETDKELNAVVSMVLSTLEQYNNKTHHNPMYKIIVLNFLNSLICEVEQLL